MHCSVVVEGPDDRLRMAFTNVCFSCLRDVSNISSTSLSSQIAEVNRLCLVC